MERRVRVTGDTDTMFDQRTQGEPAASGRISSMVPVCCVCGSVREDTGHSLDDERWVSRRAYRKTHGAMPADCVFTHTYCPSCFAQSIDTMRAG